MGNLSKADDMHDIGLSRHNYHEHNNSELRVLRVMLEETDGLEFSLHIATQTMEILIMTSTEDLRHQGTYN